MSDTKPLPKPAVWDELFPNRFLKATLLLGREHTLTIASVFMEDMPQERGDDRRRGLLSFKETDKQIVINKTNGICLKAMFGAQVQAWVGKRITIAPEKDYFGKDQVDAIRIHGSPDLAADMEVEIKLPRKSPKMRKLTKTVVGASKPAAHA